ncbi:hypothetical protein QN277_000986 [Acacia crassicarpa]|uniref:Uncharacterized protein n=1 Tax=Acacia crassicarpa TaxID=499986 RepID=A0AAE1N6E6_9FABA|nr:hypothetical protein QN277_000986 [Acacia crassicarpa]
MKLKHEMAERSISLSSSFGPFASIRAGEGQICCCFSGILHRTVRGLIEFVKLFPGAEDEGLSGFMEWKRNR